jgi:O-antigen ligase
LRWGTWAIRIALLAIIAAIPWNYGSVDWSAQRWIVGLTAMLLLVVGILGPLGQLGSGWNRSPNSSTILLLLIGLLGALQSCRVFPIDGTGTAPASVKLQRWFLGISSEPLHGSFSPTLNQILSSQSARSSIDNAASRPENANGKQLREILPEGVATADPAGSHDLVDEVLNASGQPQLAISVEPVHTRAALGSILVAASMIWLGSVAFGQASAQKVLFAVMSILGLAVGCLGFIQAISTRAPFWVSWLENAHFGTFVSKNSGGAYINVCLSGAMGLAVAWFGERKVSKYDIRYRSRTQGLLSRGLDFCEELVSGIETRHILSIIAVAILGATSIMSMSRGAALAAALGSILAFLVVTKYMKSWQGSTVAILMISIMLSLLIGFQLDEKIATRIGSMGELQQETSEGRLYIWQAAWKAFCFNILTGAGLGTFHFSVLPFQNPSTEGWFYHAESLYLQALVELGIGGALVLLAAAVGILRLIVRIVPTKSKERLPIATAFVFLASSQAFHAAVDFAMILPAVFVPSCLLLGAAFGTPIGNPNRISSRRTIPKPPQPTAAHAAGSSDGMSSAWLSVPAFPLILAALLLYSWVEMGEAVRSETALIHKKDDDPVDNLTTVTRIWNKAPAKILQSSQALRMLTEHEIQTDRRYRHRAMTELDDKTPYSMTSPLLAHLAARRLARNGDLDLIPMVMVDRTSPERWDRARRLVELAQTNSPMDWRHLWARTLLDWDAPDHVVTARLERLLPLALHHGSVLFDAAVLSDEIPGKELSLRYWTWVCRVTPQQSNRVGFLLAARYSDNQVPIEVFSDDPQYLSILTKGPFPRDKFPGTFDRLVDRMEASAHTLPDSDPNKSVYLAEVAFAKGDLLEEKKHLHRALRSLGKNVNLRRRQAVVLNELGEREAAHEAAKDYLQIDPGNPEMARLLRETKPK